LQRASGSRLRDFSDPKCGRSLSVRPLVFLRTRRGIVIALVVLAFQLDGFVVAIRLLIRHRVDVARRIRRDRQLGRWAFFG
jgi:hypothetical protein